MSTTVPVADVVAALREEAKRVRFVAAWNSAADFIEAKFGPAPKHEAGTALNVGPAGMSAYVAWCPCGWRGPISYRTRDEAHDAATQHVADEIGDSLQLMADAIALPSERGCDHPAFMFCDACGTREDFLLHESDRG